MTGDRYRSVILRMLQFSFADAYLRRSYGSETQSWDNQVANIVCCKAVLDCNLQPRTPTKSDESETAFSHDLLNNRQPVSKNVSPVLSKFFSLQKSKICDIQRQQVTARDVVLHSKALQGVVRLLFVKPPEAGVVCIFPL